MFQLKSNPIHDSNNRPNMPLSQVFFCTCLLKILKVLKKDQEVNKYFTKIEDLLSIDNYNNHLDTIFARVFTDYEGS